MADQVARDADILAAADRAAAAQSPITWGTVRAVNPDGTVTVTVDGVDRTSIPADTGYLSRQVDDSVLVARTRQGLYVIGEAGAPVSIPQPTQLAGVTMANADPPTGVGWLSVTTNVWMRSGPPMEIWLKNASAPAPPAAAPSTLTVSNNAMGTYRGGVLLHQQYAEQGQYSGAPSGNQTGVFWFPTSQLAVLSGMTISSIVCSIRRRGDQHGNTWGPDSVYVFTASGTPSQTATPTLSGMQLELGKPRLGETATGNLPTDYATGLIAGGGLAIFDPSSIHNVECDSCSLTFTYS